MPYDPERAQFAVDFIQKLKHWKGDKAGQPFILEDWQRDDIIKPLFGTVNENGQRQFTTAYIEIPRKNGKTPLVAAISAYMLYADGEQGAEMEGAAYTRDQAGKLFDNLKNFTKGSPYLYSKVDIKEYKKLIKLPAFNSYYKVIAAEAKGSHGSDLYVGVLDELHTFKDRDIVDVIGTSFGSRSEPLFLMITTAGHDKNSVCHEKHKYAINNFEDDTNKGWINENCYRTKPDSELRDPSFFCYIRAAEDNADFEKESVWYEANPALENPEENKGFKKLKNMKEQVTKAKYNPPFRNKFKRLQLNIWTDARASWIAKEKWDECAADIKEKKLENRICFGGLDLSTKKDLTGWVLLFPWDNVVKLLPRIFIPKLTIQERTKEDGVPYRTWMDQGYIIPTPGNTIDYDTIERQILQDKKRFRLDSIGYDRWEAAYIVQRLENRNTDMVPIGQGYRSMSSPTKELQRLVISGNLRHPDNPAMNWCSSNMTLEEDPAGNLKPSKKESTERIDPMVAAIMAVDRWNRETDGAESIYDQRVKEGKEDVLTEIG